MKKYSVVVFLAALTLVVFSSCSSAPKAEIAPEAPAAKADAPVPANSLNLGASSSGRAR